jgi:hypothetical protein
VIMGNVLALTTQCQTEEQSQESSMKRMLGLSVYYGLAGRLGTLQCHSLNLNLNANFRC